MSIPSPDPRIELLATELNAEIAAYVSRDAAMQQRATLLIGAASVVGALQVAPSPGAEAIIILVLSLLAAIAGVIVVFPRTGEALDVRKVRAGLKKLTLAEGREKLLDNKLEILEADDKWLTSRSWIARGGFVALALSIAVATVAAVVPDADGTKSVSTPAISEQVPDGR